MTLAKDFKTLTTLPQSSLDLATVLEIANEGMKINPKITLNNLHKFPFFDTCEGRKSFIEFLKPWAKKEALLVIEFIDSSGLVKKAEDQSTVFDLVKTCIVFDDEVTLSQFMSQICDQIDKKELFDLIIDISYCNAERAIYFFCQFSEKFVEDSDLRLKIAMTIADYQPELLLSGLGFFYIEKWENFPELTLKLAEGAPKKFLKFFEHLDVYNEDTRLQFAFACSKTAPNETIASIEKFKIEKEISFFNLLKSCSEHGWRAGDEAIFKRFHIHDAAKKEDIIILSILNQNMSSVSEIEKANLPQKIKEKLVLLALSYNYLHGLLSDEDKGHFTEQVLPKLEVLSKRTLKEKGEIFAQLLKLTTEKSKVIAFLAIEIFAFSVEDLKERKVLQKICRSGSGKHAFDLLKVLESLRKEHLLEHYLNFISDEKGDVEQALIIPALFASFWLKRNAFQSIEDLTGALSTSPKVKKKLAENGPTLRIALNTFFQMNELNLHIDLKQTFQLLCLALFYADEFHFIERLSVIETLYSISKPELLKSLLPNEVKGKEIQKAIKDLQERKDKLFPLDKTIFEKQKELEVFLSENKEIIKNLEGLRKETDQAHREVKDIEKKLPHLKRELNLVEENLLAEGAEKKSIFLREEIEHLENKFQDLRKVLFQKRAEAKTIAASGIENREAKLKRELQVFEKENKKFKKIDKAAEEIKELQALEKKVEALITNAFRDVIKNILLLDKTLGQGLKEIEDLDKKFAHTLGSMRSPNAWKVYQVDILKLKSKALNNAFNDFILGYLKGTLREERYQDNCPHNHHMIEHFPEVWKAWSAQDKGREIELQGKTYRIMNTDDPQDLFLSGIDIEGSCQNIRGANEYKKCLLSYTNDGKNRMIAIKDLTTGKIKARTIIRLLWHRELNRPALHLEPVYPKENLPKDFKKALQDYAIEQAISLRCPLYCSKEAPNTEASPGQSLLSMQSRAPFEFVDAVCGVVERGEYEIFKLYLFKDTKQH